MPRGLIIKHPKTGSSFSQLIIATVVIGPVLGLFVLWHKHLPLHFEDPWRNLAAHAALIALPLVWAIMISIPKMEFQPTEEIVLGSTKFLEQLPVEWWTILMLWPAALIGLFLLGLNFFSEYLPHPEQLSTTLLKALGIMALTFFLGLFYATMLLGNAEPRTLVSHAGLRTGMSTFHEWENIHHISRRPGDLYSLYHRANPRLPATSFTVRTPEARGTLERFASEHNVQITENADPPFPAIKISVVLGFIANLLLSLWLWQNSFLSPLWIVVISFLIGTALTLLLEWFRGVFKYTRHKPTIETAHEELPHEF